MFKVALIDLLDKPSWDLAPSERREADRQAHERLVAHLEEHDRDHADKVRT